jgi:hypothetical protein
MKETGKEAEKKKPEKAAPKETTPVAPEEMARPSAPKG